MTTMDLPPSVDDPLILHGDCLELMRGLPDGCVHLIATDPPYFRVKGDAWDRQWSDAAAFLAWIGELADEWRRILAPNGSLYVFASPQMAARVEVTIAERLAVLNSIVWAKPAFSTKAEMFDKATCRTYFPATERIIFAEHPGMEAQCERLRGRVFTPLREYIVGEFERAGMLSTAGKIWCEYESLRRPFAVSADVPYTDVWTFPTVLNYPGKHPCEKPRAMMDHIIQASSRPGDVVLDCFLGSGVTGEAAVANGRRFIGMEMGDYIHSARRRIASAVGTPQAAARVNAIAPTGVQLALL